MSSTTLRRGEGRGGGDGPDTIEEKEKEEAGGQCQARRPARQVDVLGRRVPHRSMEDRQHRPDHRLESEHRHILEKDQDGVRRAQVGRPRLRQHPHGLQREGHGEPLGDHSDGLQQVACDSRRGRGSPGKRRQR